MKFCVCPLRAESLFPTTLISLLAEDIFYEKPIFNLTAFFQNKPDSVRFGDIRLVYAPSEALAEPNIKDEYSKDRYNANFALLRIYADRDNNHSRYNNTNQPYVTDSCLTITRHYAAEDDFVFYLGYPNISKRINLIREVTKKFRNKGKQSKEIK